jgi:hypothetical protein
MGLKQRSRIKEMDIPTPDGRVLRARIVNAAGSAREQFDDAGKSARKSAKKTKKRASKRSRKAAEAARESRALEPVVAGLGALVPLIPDALSSRRRKQGIERYTPAFVRHNPILIAFAAIGGAVVAGIVVRAIRRRRAEHDDLRIQETLERMEAEQPSSDHDDLAIGTNGSNGRSDRTSSRDIRY